MSHNQRLMWLKSLGFMPADWGADVASLGRSVLVKGMRHGIEEEFWLAAYDGQALIHHENSKAKSWQELQAWITEKPAVAKPVVKERSLFGDDE